MSEFSDEWHQVLSERNRLRADLQALTDAMCEYHEEHHGDAARWCEAPPCRLIFERWLA